MDWSSGSFSVAVVLAITCGTATGQSSSERKSAPVDRVEARVEKPVADSPKQDSKAKVNAAKKSEAAVTDVNIVGKLVRSNMPFSHSPGNTALEKANAERRRYGKRPLLPDSQLQALALKKATIAAQRRYKNHIGGSLGSAKCEGVGHTNGRFLSCCLDEPGTYGGAAMVQGTDGWYCCLLVR